MTNIPRFTAWNISFIFIDLQKKLLEKISAANKIISNHLLILETARLLEIPYFATTQYRHGLGELAEPISEKITGDVPDKMTFSCVEDSDILSKIEAIRRPFVAIAGIETHICVMQTALDILRKGQQVAVVLDAVGARGEVDHRAGLDRMEKAGAVMVTTEMLVYEMLSRSDSPEFKKVLPLIKAR